MNCVAWNVRSICNKVELIMSTLIDNDAHLAFISETWFSSLSNSITAQIKSYGYDLIHVFREKRGGGAGILWKKDMQKYIRFSSVKRTFDTFHYQIIIFDGTLKTNFVCIYRFQETPYAIFCEELNSLILQLDPCNPIILTGDFNFHFENNELPEVKQLSNLMSTFGFSQFVHGPTHKKGHILDLLFANENYFTFDNINPTDFNISDHFPVFFGVPIRPSVDNQIKRQIVFRDFKAIDIPAFSYSICTDLNAAFEYNFDGISLSESLMTFNSIVSEKLNSIAPEHTKTLHSRSSPHWLDGEYKLARATRRRLERKWKNSGSNTDKIAYFEQRDKCVDMAKDKRIVYFNEIIQSKKGDMQALFKIANQIFDKNSGSHLLPQYDNAKNLADKFNVFYNEKVQNIRKQIPLSSFDRQKYTKPFNGVPLFSFRPTTVTELSEIIKTSGIKTSFHDILPAHLLKQVIDSLLPFFLSYS